MPSDKDRERVKHGPSCRTHMVEMMPNYGSDCTCGGDWTPDRQLRALFEHVLIGNMDPEQVMWVSKTLAESGYFEPAAGTLAWRARLVEEGRDD